MADTMTLTAAERTEFGKGAARRLRREKQIPATLYRHQAAPVHIALPSHETSLALRVENALLTLDVDGTEQLALAKEVQRDPIRDNVLHVDLQAVKAGEKVLVEVPIVIRGEIRGEYVVIQDQTHIELQVEATRIPADLVIDISQLQVGDQVFARDLTLPDGAVFLGQPDDLMLSIQAPRAADLGATAEAQEGEEAANEAAAAE